MMWLGSTATWHEHRELVVVGQTGRLASSAGFFRQSCRDVACWWGVNAAKCRTPCWSLRFLRPLDAGGCGASVGQQELCFAKVSLAEPMVSARQDLVFIQIVTYVGAYDVFCYLADYGCEGHRRVVGGVITCSLLEDDRHPCVCPGARDPARVHQRRETCWGRQ